ncbi:MAG: hypothetical protein ACI9FU_002248 [Granulosicoccus sp.]|jgi:hypothetical protein
MKAAFLVKNGTASKAHDDLEKRKTTGKVTILMD